MKYRVPAGTRVHRLRRSKTKADYFRVKTTRDVIYNEAETKEVCIPPDYADPGDHYYIFKLPESSEFETIAVSANDVEII